MQSAVCHIRFVCQRLAPPACSCCCVHVSASRRALSQTFAVAGAYFPLRAKIYSFPLPSWGGTHRHFSPAEVLNRPKACVSSTTTSCIVQYSNQVLAVPPTAPYRQHVDKYVPCLVHCARAALEPVSPDNGGVGRGMQRVSAGLRPLQSYTQIGQFENVTARKPVKISF